MNYLELDWKKTVTIDALTAFLLIAKVKQLLAHLVLRKASGRDDYHEQAEHTTTPEC